MNPLFYPVVALAALLFVAGYRAGMRAGTLPLRWVWYAVAGACAVPAVLFAVYYLHLFDDAVWFYRFRSLPYTELSASGAGLLAGLLYAWGARRSYGLRVLVPVMLVAGLFVPYMKAVVAPLDLTRLEARCRDGVCLQTAPSTCGPASAASILRMFDFAESEKTLAEEAYTSSGGTENWYLARAIRRRGFPVEYVVLGRPVARLPHPSVAGVTLPGGTGHFISILTETDQAYVIGDPMHGKLTVPKARLAQAYDFTGFFMVVGAEKK